MRSGRKAHLGQELEAAGEHGVDAADAGEVEGGGQLLLAHAQAQQVARRHVAQQDLLKQVVQRLRIPFATQQTALSQLFPYPFMKQLCSLGIWRQTGSHGGRSCQLISHRLDQL